MILDIFNHNNAVELLSAAYPNQRVYFVKTDVSDNENVKLAFKAVHEKLKTINIVIANAGILDESQFEKMVQINVVSDMIINNA